MGIKDLWSILQPYCERKPLYELEGKIVAIDLAGWVCESLCVVDYEVQPRFYLRNLFFRTCFLVLSGVTPVFVLEGDAPPLKYGVICKRNAIQFRGARPRNDNNTQQKKDELPKKPQKGRSRFNYVLKQCEDLLLSMGLQCVQGPGEAEAFCAYMNQDKMVDGIISQDSDCFAYGAVKVYRNFSVSMQGQTAAQGGAVDVYDMARVCENMDFGQNKMIAMALLNGCDYCPDGVPGVGKDAVTKFFDAFSNREVLDRIKSWRENDQKYTSLELKVDDKSICVNCGHHGRVQMHTKNGCALCRQHRGCDSSLWKNQRLSIKSELVLRQKAIKIDSFPSQAIIDEFLCRPVNLPKLDLNWRQPNLIKFLKFMSKLLQWEEIYCWQKFLPLLTRWQLFHFSNAANVNADSSASQQLKGILIPKCIKKKRAPKGVASYEIIWSDDQNCFNDLIPEEQINLFLEQNSNNLQILWSTIEPEDLVQKAYPKIVEEFLMTKTKPKSKKTAVGTKKKDDPAAADANPKPKKTQKPKRIKNIENQPPSDNALIERFFKKTKTVRKQSSTKNSQQSPKLQTTSSPINLSNFSINFNDDASFDEHDLSNAIQSIVSRPPDTTEILGHRLRFNELADKQISSSCADVSLDEFDLMIMKEKPLHSLQEISCNASTPIQKKLKSQTKTHRNSRKRESLKFNSKLLCDDNSRNKINSDVNNVNCSNFFDDITKSNNDLFEKSIDFYNMPDEFDAVVVNANSTNGNDTFDLANYVPVGAKLMKKLNR